MSKGRKLDDSLNTSNPVEGGGRNGGGDGEIDGYGIPMKIEMQNMSDIGMEALLDTDSNTSY